MTPGREAQASRHSSPAAADGATARAAFDARDLALALGLAAAVALLLRDGIGVWFTYDDFFQVRFVGRHGAGELLASPATWAQLPMRMLTPLLFLSLWADRRLFGLEAAAYQAHQLLAYALVVAALYLVARLWHHRPAAAGLALLAALGPAMTGLAPLLMVRHYVEGGLAALVATGLFVVAARRESGWRSAALALGSALAYALAALAKEVFVPLPLLLVALPEGAARARLRRLAPHGVVLVLYAAYRRWLLGTWTGGYGFTVDASALYEVIARLPLRLLEAAATPGGAAGAALVALVSLATVALVMVRPAARLAVGAATLGLLGPLLPVAAQVEARWAAVPWIAGSFAAVALVVRLPRPARRLAWVALALLLAVTHLLAWPRTLAAVGRVSEENRSFLRLGPGDLLRLPASPPEALFELARFKQQDLGLGAPPGWFADDMFLCGGRRAGDRIWQYDAKRGAVVERTRRARLEARRHCRSIRWRAPLTARLVWRGATLRWELGPHDDGTYSLVVGDGVVRLPLPASGGFRRAGGPLRLRVRYDSPAGWVTYSDELDVKPESEVVWSRGV